MSRNVTQEISTTDNLNPDHYSGGRSQKADHLSIIYVFCVQFTGTGLHFSSSARIFLVLESQLRDRKIGLVPYKLSLLVRSQYQGQTRKKWLRVIQWVITAIMTDHFVWRYQELIIVISASKESRRAQIVFLWFSPAMLNSLST